MWHNILGLHILAFQTLCPVTVLLNWVTPSGKSLSPSTDLGFSTRSWVRRSLGEHSIGSSTKTTTRCTSKFRRFLTLPWLRQPLWFVVSHYVFFWPLSNADIHMCWDRKLPSACLEHAIQSWRAEGATTHIWGKQVVLCAAVDVILHRSKTWSPDIAVLEL